MTRCAESGIKAGVCFWRQHHVFHRRALENFRCVTRPVVVRRADQPAGQMHSLKGTAVEAVRPSLSRPLLAVTSLADRQRHRRTVVGRQRQEGARGRRD